jgi:uncharacterized protein (TIGR03435 family)
MTNRIAIALISAAVFAQQPAGPRFDVVSIRLAPADAPSTYREFGATAFLPGGQYIDSRVGLHSMTAFAFNVPNTRQLVGLPKWAEEQSFSVAAKPAEGFPALSPAENREQVRQMMRAMLADRFHLQLHTEDRQEAIFQLGIAKGGVRIKEAPPPVFPGKEMPVQLVLSNGGGRTIGEKSTIQGIASALAVWLKSPVIDQTGLNGYYDWDVRWAAPDGQNADGQLDARGIGLLIGMLPDQFGLRLTKAAGPVRYWVVDHVEPPSGN